MKQNPYLRGIASGMLVMLLLSLALAGICAGAVLGGLLPMAGAGAAACGISLLAGLGGGVVCAKRAGGKRLPVSLACGGIYLVFVFILRGLVFRDVAREPWVMSLFVLAGCLVGAVMASGKKRKSYR